MKKNKIEQMFKKGTGSLYVLALVWGLLPIFPRYLNANLQLFQQVYLRLFFAFLFSLLFFFKDIGWKKILKLTFVDWAVLILRALAFYTISLTLLTKAVLLTKISNVLFISAIPFTALLGFFLLNEKLSLKKILAVFASFVGIVIISVTDYSHLFIWGKGEILALLSSFFGALSYILRKKQTKILNSKEITVIMLFFGCLFSLIASFATQEGYLASEVWNWGLLIALLLSGALNTASTFLINYGFNRVKTVLANNILALEPVFATLFAFLFFREIPQVKEFIGAGVILFAILYLNALETSKPTHTTKRTKNK